MHSTRNSSQKKCINNVLSVSHQCIWIYNGAHFIIHEEILSINSGKTHQFFIEWSFWWTFFSVFFFSIVLCAWLGFDLFLIDLFGKLDMFRHQMKWAGVSICLVLIIWWKRSCWWPIIRMKSSILELVWFALSIQPFAQHDMAFCYAIGFLVDLAYFEPCCVNFKCS